MVDEMFLQKEARYQSGDYVGEDEEGELYKRITCFMIVGLKQSVPHVIQAIPEVIITILLTKTTAAQNEVALRYHGMRGLYYLAVVFVRSILLRVTSPKNWQKKRSNCDSCKSLLIASSMDLAENHYLNLLSRGGLIVPSAKLAEYTSHCFAIMDYSYNIVQAHGVRDVRAAYTQIFDRFSPQIDIC